MHCPVIKTSDINALNLPAADLMVVIAFGQKISESATHHARLGSINLHASLLPRHRGAAPINAAILSGDAVTGNSIIRLASKMDAGAVLGQSSLAIGEMETAGELHDRLSLDGVALMLRVIDELRHGTASEVEQDSASATLARKLSRETARIDWNHSAETIARQIRGLWPWPGCRVAVMDGETSLDTLGLVRAQPAGGLAGQMTGQLNDQLCVGTGDGRSVRLVEVQPAGKRSMSIEAYARGKRWTPGLRLVAI